MYAFASAFLNLGHAVFNQECRELENRVLTHGTVTHTSFTNYADVLVGGNPTVPGVLGSGKTNNWP